MSNVGMADTNAMREADVRAIIVKAVTGRTTLAGATSAILALLATDRAAGVGEVTSYRQNDLTATLKIFPKINGGMPFDVGTVLYAASPPAPADASDFSPHRWTEIISNGLGANNAGCWRCGALSEVLARVLSLSGHDAKVIQGKANGEDHVWVQIGDTVYDPTVGQFQEPVSYQMDQVAPADASGEVDPDVRHRLLEVAKTLDAAKGNAFALNFHQLAHDIRAALNPTAGEK